jgi:UDPglucose 6-dehydrogenase
MEETQRLYGQQPLLQLCGTKEAALQNADMLVIMTEWRQFKAPDFDAIKRSLKHPVIFDGRNLFDPIRMQEKGIEYHGIGRGQTILHAYTQALQPEFAVTDTVCEIS